MITIHSVPLSRFRITAQDHPTTAVAAEELRSHLQAYCGYTQPDPTNSKTVDSKRILIGALPESSCTHDLASLAANDSFFIRSSETSLEICGKTPTGTLYGVYHFLNLLGIEWLTPDITHAEVDPDLDFRDSLAYDFPCEFRVIHAYNVLYSESSAQFRTRQCLAYTVGPATKNHRFADVRGIEYAFGWGMFGHTFEKFIPYETYFKTHPEYFSFAPGEYGQNGRYQICLTNPEVFEIVKEQVLSYLAEHPETRILSVSQNDSWGKFADNFCKCPSCQRVIDEEGALSGAVLRFVNGIADAVKDDYPDVLIHTFAYNATTKPPKITKPRDNVMIQLCLSHEAHFSMQDDVPACRRCKNELDVWRPITNHLQLWTYNTHFDRYFAPKVNLRSIYEDTRYMLENRVYGIFQQECGDPCPFEFHDLRVWLLAKLFRYPDMSYDTYLGYVMRFLRGFYGAPSAGAIFAYLMEAETLYAVSDPSSAALYDKHFGEFANWDFIRRGKRHWEEALRLAENEIFRARIEDSKKSFDFAELVCLYAQMQTEEDRALYAEKKKNLYTYMYTWHGQNKLFHGEGPARRIYDISKVDWTSAPIALENCMKEVTVPYGAASAPQTHEANTDAAVTDFGFSFTVERTQDTLCFDIDVTDPDPTHTTDNILAWEQDSVELYFSETLHKTAAIRDGDFSVRVNAGGLWHISSGEDDRIAVTSDKTDHGYRIRVGVRFAPELLQAERALGFEIIAHNIGDHGYRNTVYFNSAKNADMSAYPKSCGKLIMA